MMSRQTGAMLEELDHIKQSIQDILLTPIGSRVMRREYGSLLFELIDQPFNDTTSLQIIAAAANAIMTWEPRIDISQLVFEKVGNGKFELMIDAVIKLNGQQNSISVPLSFGASM